MREIMNNHIHLKQQGGILIIALFFVAIVAAIGLSLIMSTQIEYVASNNYAKNSRATFAAQSGLERMKAYLIYDFKKDPDTWKNDKIIVPPGTPGSLPSTDVTGENEISIPGYPTSAPSFVPYLLPASIQDFNYPTLLAATSFPNFVPSSGYQIFLRPIPKVAGGNSVDPNQICIDAAGYTGTSKSMLGMNSRGMNMLEQCIVASDISVWNNIVFSTTPASSGMGDIRIHGNVHLLGPANPIPSTATTILVKGNASWSNSYRDPGLASQARIPSLLSNTLDPDEDARTELGAFVRIRNGLVDSSGSPDIGTSAVPFEGVYGCEDCGGTFGFTTPTYPKVHAHEISDYDIPADIEDVLLVPQTTNQYREHSNNILYPDYPSYLKGVYQYPVGTVYDLPGVQALQLAWALQVSSEVNMVLDDSTNTTTNLAGKIWQAKDNIFVANTKKATTPKDHTEQTPLDIVASGETPLNTVIESSLDHSAGNTFLLVATNAARNVFIIYKEVEPYDRVVDTELSGGAHSALKHFKRQVHGMVYIPSMTQNNLDNLQLIADLDGADRDSLNGDYAPVTLGAGANATSHQLIRKVVNALWLASRGMCSDDSLPGTIDDSCFNRPLSNGSANDGTRFDPSISPTLYGTSVTNSIRALNNEAWFVGSGVIQVTDQLTIGPGNDLRFVGKTTLFAEDQFPGGTAGDFYMQGGPLSVNRYEYPSGSGKWYSFPCNNGLGFLSSHDISLGAPGGTHTAFAGAFYAQNQVHIMKQIQILGAMVAGNFLFDGGGTPDWYQSMEIPRCLPPQMIGGDPIVLTKSQGFVQR